MQDGQLPVSSMTLCFFEKALPMEHEDKASKQVQPAKETDLESCKEED